MYDANRIAQILNQRRPQHTLPQACYVDADFHEFDLQAIFYRNWHMVGFEAELRRPGSYLATSIGRSPVIVLRGRQGDIVGFHNSCRHRGAQICANGRGRVPRLVCPYHQWTYDLDGRLLAARGSAQDFDAGLHGFVPLRVETVAGCIYIALSADAPDFTPFRRVLEPALTPHKLLNIKLAHEVTLTENANWKLVMENGRECHHCEACHPELKNAFPMEISEGKAFLERESQSPFMQRMKNLGFETVGETGDWWQVGRFPFKDGVVSYSTDGKPLVRKMLNDANDGNLGSLRWAIEPSNFCHVSSDCVFTFDVNPTGPLSSVVTAKWLVHEDAVEGEDYDLDRLIHLWNETNLQDRDLAENNQRGVNGAGYTPGPYSADSEPYVLRFVDWYCDQSIEFLKNSRQGLRS